MDLYLDLFLTFAKVGVCTFGGGYAMLPILQREVVENKGWATEEELTDYFAIGQCTPGIIAVNTATFIGYKYKGILGGILTTLGVVFPSLIIITLIAAFLSNFAHIPAVQHALAGVNACVVALIASSVIKLGKSTVKDGPTVFIYLLVLALAIALFFYFRQTKVISRARRELAALTQELISLNRNLDEANLVKERYLGYFMNQCAIYINKLDKYRRDINLKIRNKQFDRLHDLSLQAPGREEEELCRNFDRAFLNLYPNFVEKFNALLNPRSRYTPEEGRLNTELRIFALIRLGVSDVNQIADFLRCSPQTIYNYKSKIKKAALNGGDNFEETVRKLGSLSLDAFPSCLPADNV